MVEMMDPAEMIEPMDPAEVEARGEAIYEKLASQLEAEHYGKVVVIDIASGDYVIGDNDHQATLLMDELHPYSWNWGRAIGGDGAVAQFSAAMTLEYLKHH